MTYEKRLLHPVFDRLEQMRVKSEAEAAERQNRIYETLPEIAEIDFALQSAMLEVAKHAFQNGISATVPLAKLREENLALQKRRAEILQNAGYPADYTEQKYQCNACRDTGYIGQTLCACVDRMYREALVSELSESVGVGVSGFSSFRLDLYSDLKFGGATSPREQMAEVLEFCKNYAGHFSKKSPNLLIVGDTGSGKTLISACIAHEVVRSGASVVFDTAFRTFSRFEADRFGRAEEEDGSTRRYYESDLLVIDGLGGEVITQYSTAQLGDLIAQRELREKPTIINTALSAEEFRLKYKKPLAARIEGGFVRVPMFGQDNRGK
ncbi:MAG: ATP-binding protein [Oscillospiraceae bacterium]|nr:ATP-binding protein [Oscillospiraceae bacterium]